MIRFVGFGAVVLIAIAGAGPDPWDAVASLGVLLLVGFLWLTLSGFFGYGSAGRADWVGLVPFAIALVVRQLFTLHSVQEIEIQFAHGPVGRHSVVYPLLQMFFVPLVRDPHWFTMHMNGVLGAVACLSMYLFVRQRLESRVAGFLCALFLAIHPLVARFSPTDGPYSLLLAAWFSGLAFLSTPDLDGRSMFAGAVLLGIAATARMEGSVFLVASLLLLDGRALLDAARRHRLAAVASFLAVYVQFAVQMAVLLPTHLSGPTPISALIPSFEWLFEDAVWPAQYNDRLFRSLVWIGAAAGVLRRYRLGLLAFIAMLIVLAPVTRSGHGIALHRLVPACAVQTLVAGIGAYALAAWIPTARRKPWLVAVPGVVAAFYILAHNRGELTKPYVFTEEYELVRHHLGPGGIAGDECRLLAFSAIVPQDIDIHDFRQVVPDVGVLDCTIDDCRGELAAQRCLYYVRSAAAYFHPAGIPPDCAASGMTAAGDRIACMNAPSAAFERSVELEPVEVRTIDILQTFPDRRANYPERAEVGLFRVRAKDLQ